VNRSGAPLDAIGQPPDLTVPAFDRLPAALPTITVSTSRGYGVISLPLGGSSVQV
jgi:hypothetical protein